MILKGKIPLGVERSMDNFFFFPLVRELLLKKKTPVEKDARALYVINK